MASDNGNIKIRLKADQDRLKGMKWGTYRRLKLEPEAQHEFISLFLVDEDGNYLDEDGAAEVLDELSLDQIGDVFQELQGQMEDTAVPNG